MTRSLQVAVLTLCCPSSRPLIADCLGRTAFQGFAAQAFLFGIDGLFEHDDVASRANAFEIVWRNVAADFAINTAAVHKKAASDIFRQANDLISHNERIAG
jgi:hypothetical protein